MIACLLPRPASAQQVPEPTEDPVASARIHVGALGLTPRVGLTNLGWDTNVFNEVSDPKKDFTFTVAPGTAVWLRTGRGLLSFDGNLELVYFNTYDTERSVNGGGSVQYELRFNRMRPYVSVRALNTRQRPGFEIDARARHYETEYRVGSDLRVASKSTMRLELRDLDYSFAGDAVFGGRVLNQELNRTARAAELSWRQRLTALTTWVARTSVETERFEFEQARNADSLRVSSGFELGRFALVRGAAFAGYRKLKPADGGVLPEFSGVTADVGVAYTAPTQTRLSASVARDVQYSYERQTPYYVQTSWTTGLTQRVIGRWDVQLSGGRDRLAYQALLPRDIRTDHVERVGGGIGYTVGEQLRVGLDVQSYFRASDLPGRDYRTLRGGVSVMYGY